MSNWEPVIGLEVHTELKTNTKLFCGCPNEFGNEPNTNICAVCLGLPGSLPVLNKRAVELAMAIGLALNCTVKPAVFSRKNYFYPDMPKDYQVSQYDLPTNIEGYLDLPDGSQVGIERAHIEEDTGKSTHIGGSGRIHGADSSLVDYNRAGVPLVEIVSKPDIRSAEQAKAYVSELRAILVAIGASDGKMEEGSLRCDANVSVRQGPDAPFGTRCEIKNVNSLRSLQRAIEFEIDRQIEVLEDGGKIKQETRHWDESSGETISGRSKEQAEDYRYFPEPDLVPLNPSQEWINSVRESQPPLPSERRQKVAETLKISAEEHVKVTDLVAAELDSLVMAAVSAGADGRTALNRALNEVAAKPEGVENITPESFTTLVKMETDGKITATQAKTVIAEMLDNGGDPEAIAKSKGFEAMDTGALESIVDQVISENPAEVERFKEGDQKLAGFFVGKIMAASQGKADGKAATALLRQKLGL